MDEREKREREQEERAKVREAVKRHADDAWVKNVVRVTHRPVEEIIREARDDHVFRDSE